MDKEKRKKRMELISAIEKERDNSRVLCYLTSDRRNLEARIAKDALPFIYEHLKVFGHVPKIDLFLFTNGGDTLAGFGIVNKIREFCEHFGVLVPFKALSCGTLICLGADEIIMNEMGTLSPIDPTVANEYNPIGRPGSPQAGQLLPLSVEDVAAFLNFAKREGQINNLDNVFLKLSSEVSPIALGRAFRAREQIIMLGKKLLSTHHKKLDSSEIDRIVNYLSRELGSHDYEISRTEAKEKLQNVIDASTNLSGFMWELYGAYRELMDLDSAFEPEMILGSNQQFRYETSVAIVESTARLDYFQQVFDLRRVKIPQPQGIIAEGIQHKALQAGWMHITD
ncbi:MAG: SDH family Clp fold serine proteinase [Dissulfurispiraceae bacterium]